MNNNKNIFLVEFKPGTPYETAFSCLANLNFMQSEIQEKPQNYDFGVKILKPFIEDISFPEGVEKFINTLLKGGYVVLAKEDWNGLNSQFLS